VAEIHRSGGGRAKASSTSDKTTIQDCSGQRFRQIIISRSFPARTEIFSTYVAVTMFQKKMASYSTQKNDN
jgi:hypothetical protein